MNAIEIILDGELFSVDVVARTAHRYTGDYYVETVCTPASASIRLTPKTERVNSDLLAERFRNDSLDERLRERIRAETGELHTALVLAALQQAAALSSAIGQDR